MSPRYQTLEITRPDPAIMLVTLNRPEVRNAINSVMMQELRDLWQALRADSAATRCVILTGKGDKAFCAGADLKERHGLDVATWKEQHVVLEQAMVAMLQCPVPIIAAVNGAAFGGGLELALGCDFIYASRDATFALPETKIGIMPGAMGTQNLPLACGIRRAREICLTGAPFSAEEGLQWGVVNRLCDPAQLLPETLATAQTIAANAPLAVRQAKKALNFAAQTLLAEGYPFEIEAYNQLLPTEDRKEGIAAFNEKRKPKFTGR